MGNEKADLIAKESLQRAIIDNNNIWFEELFGRFKGDVKVQMTNYIKGYDFGRGRKGIKFVDNNGSFDLDPWFSKYNLDRKRIIMINRIKISNHVRTKDHLFKKNIVESNLCECLQVESLDHLIWYCPRYNLYRDLLIVFLIRRGIGFGSDICVLFNRSNISIIQRIILFILLNEIII